MKVQRDSLREAIKEDPLKLFHLASKSMPLEDDKHVSYQDPRKHLEKTAFLQTLGLAENSEEMEKAAKQFRGRGDQLQERFDCLVRAGLGVNAVSGLVKQAPMVLNQSKDVIEKKIDYLTNHLGYPLETIVSFPTYLCYDKRRIMQRFSMYAWLKVKAGSNKMLSLSTLLACSDARFVKYFVDVHPEGPPMWKSLQDCTF